MNLIILQERKSNHIVLNQIQELQLLDTLTGFKRFLFALDEVSFRMLFSDQITKDSQFLATRNIMDRVNRIAPFFQYDDDPYIFVREDGTLAWMIDAYLSAENYPYSE